MKRSKSSLDCSNVCDSDDQSLTFEQIQDLKKRLTTAGKVQQFVLSEDGLKFAKLLAYASKITTEILGAEAKSQDFCLKCRETLSLVANCCHFSLNACLDVKNKNFFLSQLVRILIKKELSFVGLKAVVMRLIANLCDHKESAVAVIQTQKALETVLKYVGCLDDSKLQMQSVRVIRLLTQISSSFAKTILAENGAYSIGCVIKQDTPSPSDSLLQSCMKALYHFCMASARDCGRQLALCSCVEKISNYLLNNIEQQGPELRLLTELCRHSFDMRSALVECGFMRKIGEFLEIGTLENSVVDSLIGVLCLFAQDAYARVTMRTEGQLNYLVSVLSNSTAGSCVRFEISSAFKCFVYDQPGLTFLAEQTDFLQVFQEQLKQYNNANTFICDGNGPQQSKATEYRPDSPNYVEIKKRYSQRNNSLDETEGPLCRDFATPLSPPVQIGGVSPGPSWSPAGSTLVSSPNYLSDVSFEDNYSFSHVTTEGGLSSDMNYHQISTQTDNDKVDNMSNSNRETHAINSQLTLISCLSHDEKTMKYLLRADLLQALVEYVAQVRTASPRCGRLLRRMARSAQLLDSLLNIEFASVVYNNLCDRTCLLNSNKNCVFCERCCRIGCELLADMSSQADSYFGIGLIEHRLLSAQNDMEKFITLTAVPLLIKSPNNRKKFFCVLNGLKLLIDMACDFNADTTMSTGAARSLRAIAKRRQLESELIDSRLADDSSVCHLQTDNISTNDAIIYNFPKLDNTIAVSRTKLQQAAEFFRGLFSGDYREASQNEFVFDSTEQEVNEQDFAFLLHFIHGCRRCQTTQIINGDQCLSLLKLSDRYLCPLMFDWLMTGHVTRFIDLTNIHSYLLFSLVTHGAVRITNLSIATLLRYGCVKDLLETIFIVNENRLLREFKTAMTDYLLKYV